MSTVTKSQLEKTTDNRCSVCLGNFKDKSFIPICFHAFCFNCIREWSRQSNVCPLCKGSFDRIIHKVKSDTNYKEYIINVNKTSQTQTEYYPFYFPEYSLNRQSSLLDLHIRILDASNSSFEETRASRSSFSRRRRSVVLSPLNLRRNRKRSNHIILISDEDSESDIQIDSDKSEKKNPDIDLVCNPMPSTSGTQHTSNISCIVIESDDNDDEDNNINLPSLDTSLVFIKQSTSKKCKSNGKFKKKSYLEHSDDASAMKRKTNNKMPIESYESGYEADGQEDEFKNIKKSRTQLKKGKFFNNKLGKLKDANEDDLEVIEILSQNSLTTHKSVKKQNNDELNSNNTIRLCDEGSENENEEDCVYLLSKDNKNMKNINKIVGETLSDGKSKKSDNSLNLSLSNCDEYQQKCDETV